MKKSQLIVSLTLLFIACKNQLQMENKNFKSEMVSNTATIMVNGKIETVFSLFGAFEERKWAEGWAPNLIYPSIEKIEEGTTFSTPGHGHNESKFLWIVSKYQPGNMIQYIVTTENRHWTITIQCNPLVHDQTNAVITYSFTGHNNLGNEINRHSIEKMYERNLKDWEEALNYYLANGKLLKD